MSPRTMRSLLLLALLAAISMIGAGCGSDDGGSPEKATTSTEEQPAETIPADPTSTGEEPTSTAPTDTPTETNPIDEEPVGGENDQMLG